MNSKIKKLWLKALRSGKYKQGRGQLKTHENKFCCLGVLCDIHSKQTKRKWDDINYYLNQDYILPHTVIKWAGLDNNNPMVKDRNAKQYCLSAFNDGSESEGINKRTFEQIANYIEKSL